MFCFLNLAEPSWKDYENHGGKWTSRSYPIISGKAVMKAVLIPLKFQKLVKPRKKKKSKKKRKKERRSPRQNPVKVLIFHQDPRNTSETVKNSFKSGIGAKFICLG